MSESALVPSKDREASALRPVGSGDAAHVRASHAVMRKHAKSFRFASLFLPQQAADEAAVLYAFCRAVDDAVDEAPSRDAARVEGELLDDELRGRRAPRPEVAAFLDLAVARGIDLTFAHDLVLGARSDAEGPVRIPDDDALLQYCYRVAGTVGGMMCPVIGVREPDALPFALSLGIAMQLTNICRDVLDDARMDRVYLPARRLRAAGIDPEALVRGGLDADARARLAGVVRDVLALADRHYRTGDRGMHFIPWRARVAIVVASRVYGAIGARLVQVHGGDALHGRTMVPFLGKLRAAVQAFAALPRLPAGPKSSALPAQRLSRSDGA